MSSHDSNIISSEPFTYSFLNTIRLLNLLNGFLFGRMSKWEEGAQLE